MTAASARHSSPAAGRRARRRALIYSRTAAIREIGISIRTPEQRDASDTAKKLRDELSLEIVNRLAPLGYENLRRKNTLRHVGVISGEIAGEAETWGNSNLLPSVQHRNNAANRAALEIYLNKHPKGQYARYAVLTGGDRVHRSQIRSRWSTMSRRLSKFIAKCRTEFPWIEFVSRTNECAIDAKNLSTHPHFNLVYIPHRRVSKIEFKRFLRALRRAMRGHVQDCGRIRDIRELIKYTTKFVIAKTRAKTEIDLSELPPAEEIDAIDAELSPELIDDNVIDLEDASMPVFEELTEENLRKSLTTLFDVHPEEGERSILETLHLQMFKMRRFEAFGEFREFRQTYKNRRLIPRQIGESAALLKMAKYAPRPEKSDAPPEENKLVSVTMPRPLGWETLLIEPALVVNNYVAQPRTKIGWENLAKLRAARARVLAVLDPSWARHAKIEPGDISGEDLTVYDFETGEVAETLQRPAPAGRPGAARHPENPKGEGVKAAANETALYRTHMHDNCPPAGGRNHQAGGRGRGAGWVGGAEIIAFRPRNPARAGAGHQIS